MTAHAFAADVQVPTVAPGGAIYAGLEIPEHPPDLGIANAPDDQLVALLPSSPALWGARLPVASKSSGSGAAPPQAADNKSPAVAPEPATGDVSSPVAKDAPTPDAPPTPDPAQKNTPAAKSAQQPAPNPPTPEKPAVPPLPGSTLPGTGFVGLAPFGPCVTPPTPVGCLETPPPGSLTVEVDATSQQGTLVPGVKAGATYFLLVRGVFMFSVDGCQDGLRRWHKPYQANPSEPVCVGCDYFPDFDRVDANFSFQVDGLPPTLVRECLFASTYLFAAIPTSHILRLSIHDGLGNDPAAWDDNKGSLKVTIYPAPANHPLLLSDAPGFRLGHPVGKYLGGGVLRRGKVAKIPWLTEVPDLLIPLDTPVADVLVEVRGLMAIGAGIETGPLNAWSHIEKVAGGTVAPVTFACAKTEALANDPAAHRALFRAKDCPSPLHISFTPNLDSDVSDDSGGFHIEAFMLH
ncbi:MAG: hypothetical protein AMXMBFR64_12750 [Myxococcales bacterium]